MELGGLEVGGNRGRMVVVVRGSGEGGVGVGGSLSGRGPSAGPRESRNGRDTRGRETKTNIKNSRWSYGSIPAAPYSLSLHTLAPHIIILCDH